jgi:hypothetical protein
MDWWTIGLIAVIAVGLAAIVFGALSDRRKNRKAVTQMLSPPPRTIPQLPESTKPPHYLSGLQARRPPPSNERPALSEESRHEIAHQLRSRETTKINIGYASEAFITDRGTRWAILDRPRVLTSAEPIMSIRELISVVEHMITDGSPLVVVAPSMAPDVLSTLEVNHIQRKIDLVVVLTQDPLPVDAIVEATGAQLVSRVDLQTGYLADADLGRCDRWVSDAKHSYLIGRMVAPSDTGDGDQDQQGQA